MNRNIFNSDNYRYLIFLLLPWSLGFGLLLRSLCRWAVLGRVAAVAAVVLLAAAMTASVGRVVRPARLARRPPDASALGSTGMGNRRRPDPIARWLASSVADGLRSRRKRRTFIGDYWDVYRIAFLSEGGWSGSPSRPIRTASRAGRAASPAGGACQVLDRPPGWPRCWPSPGDARDVSRAS